MEILQFTNPQTPTARERFIGHKTYLPPYLGKQKKQKQQPEFPIHFVEEVFTLHFIQQVVSVLSCTPQKLNMSPEKGIMSKGK